VRVAKGKVNLRRVLMVDGDFFGNDTADAGEMVGGDKQDVRRGGDEIVRFMRGIYR